jgi:hypothetical protein
LPLARREDKGVSRSERGCSIDAPRGSASLSMAIADADTKEVARARRTERDFILEYPGTR